MIRRRSCGPVHRNEPAVRWNLAPQFFLVCVSLRSAHVVEDRARDLVVSFTDVLQMRATLPSKIAQDCTCWALLVEHHRQVFLKTVEYKHGLFGPLHGRRPHMEATRPQGAPRVRQRGLRHRGSAKPGGRKVHAAAADIRIVIVRHKRKERP